MSGDTLPVLTRSAFPQVFEQAMLQEVLRVPSAHNHLVRCYWSDEFCTCRELGVVHDLKSEQDFCLRHFLMVGVRRG